MKNNFFLPKNYQARETAEHHVDSTVSDSGVTWRSDVYPAAARIGKVLGSKYIIEIGCGQARNLAPLSKNFRLVGVDCKNDIRHCVATYPFGTWIESDLERDNDLQIKPEILRNSIVICSNVIEHLTNPLPLLRQLKKLLSGAPVVLLSTPDRARTYGKSHQGPPPNKSHTREWEIRELEKLLVQEGFAVLALGYTRSNDSKNLNAMSLFFLGNSNRDTSLPSLRAAPLLREFVFDTAEDLSPASNDAIEEDERFSFDMAPLAIAQQAIRLNNSGQRKAALELIQRNLETHTDSHEIYLALADVALKANDVATFNQSIQRVLQLSPENRACFHYLADINLANGSLNSSVDLYTHLWKKDPADLAALGGLLMALAKLGKVENACELLREITNLQLSEGKNVPKFN